MIRVLIADDHALLRHGVRALLAEAGGFEVVAEASDGRQAAHLAARYRPEVVLMDVDMPGLCAVEAVRQVKRAVEACRVLMLGTHATEEQLLVYLAAGASGFVLKESTGAELIGALRDVHRAAFYVSSAVSRKVLDRWHRHAVKPRRSREAQAAGGDGSERLTERERELLDLVAAGLPNRAIAERMRVSVKTVEAHKAHVIAKLELKGAHDLMRYAVHRRWPAANLSA